MKKRKVTAVITALAVVICSINISIKAEAAETTYDPNATKTGYHLVVDAQFNCHHEDNQGRAIYTTMTGLTPSEGDVTSRIVNSGGLNFSTTSYQRSPSGAGAHRIGSTVVDIHVSNVGNAYNGVQDLELSGNYVAEGTGYSGYAYYIQMFSHCEYTGLDYYVGAAHSWLGDAFDTVGINEYHPRTYDHLVTRYRFEPNHYNVVYNGNGADSGSVGSQSVAYDQTFNLNNNGYERWGYAFRGWNTAWDGSGTWYNAGQSVSNLTATDGATITLYAIWSPVNYKVRYDGNGATSGSMTDQSMTFGYGAQLSTNQFRRDYIVTFNGNGGTSSTPNSVAQGTFKGWLDYNTYYFKGMYFNFYGFDAPYYVNKHPDVRTVWGYNKYATLEHWYINTINGNENRQSSPWFRINDYMTYGGGDLNAAFGSNKLAFVSHYMSNGVYEGRTAAVPQDGTTSQLYPNQAWVANLGTREGETVTLKADWALGSVTLPNASRNGWEFTGWYDRASGGSLIGNTGSRYTPSSNTTLYAHWKDVKKPDIPYTPAYPVDPDNPYNPNATVKEIVYDWVGTPVPLNVTATDDGSGVKSFKMYDNETSTVIANGTKVNDYLYKIDYTSRNEGISRFRFETYDNWNNKNTLYITTKIDYTAPEGDVTLGYEENGINCDITNITEIHSGVDKAWVVIKDASGRSDVDTVTKELNLTSGSNIHNGSSFGGFVEYNESMKQKSESLEVEVWIQDKVGNNRMLKSETYDVFYLTAQADRILGNKTYWSCGEAGNVTFTTGQFTDSVEVIYPYEWIALDNTLGSRVFDYTSNKSKDRTDRDMFIIPIYAEEKDYSIKVIAHKWGRTKEVEIPIFTSGDVLEELKTTIDYKLN